MEMRIQINARFLPPRRWFPLTLSMFGALILLSAILLFVGSAEAEPLAPAADIFGQVVDPGGIPITDTTWVCLMHLYPGEGWADWDVCNETDIRGNFVFTGPIPLGDLFVVAEAPWYSDYFPSLPKPFYLANATDVIALGNVTLTYASFAGMVYEPDGVTLADGGWVSVMDEFWNDVAGADYFTGTYAVGGVPDGNFQLVAHPPDDSVFVSSPQEPVSVTPGSQYFPGFTQYYTLTLQDPNLIGMVVYPDGSPVTWILSGTEVIGQAWAQIVNDDWSIDIERYTASWGEFGFRVPAGDYRIIAHPDGELVMTYTHSMPRPVAVPSRTVVSLTDPFTLTYPSFMGMVLDPFGNPVPDCVDVWLETLDGEWMTYDWYCSDDPRPYMLGGVPDGDYWLMTSGLPEHGLLPAEPLLVHVDPGSQYDPGATQFYDLFLQPAAGPLSVFALDPLGTPITAHVVLEDEWGYEEWLISRPDQPAQFLGLEPGEYLVQAWPSWRDIPALANSAKVPVFITDPLTITLGLLYPDVIGVVTTPEGGPLPPAHDEWWNPVHPAEISVHDEDWTIDLWVATNGDGDFSLALPDGLYFLDAHPYANLAFTYTKSLPRSFAVDPVGGSVDLGPISLTYPCIQGWVADLDGNRVSAWVDLWNEDGGYWEGDETLWYPPDVEKPFRFGGLVPDHYFVRSGPPYDDPGGYGSSNIYDFFVPDDCGQEITLTLEVANFIGHLLLPPDDPWCPECPVPWAEVKVRTVSGNFEDWTSTDENGRFAFSGLPTPGAYVVRAFVPYELEFEYDPPPLEYFTLDSPDQVVSRTLHLQPAVRNKHVIGVVVYDDDGSPVGDADGDGMGDALVYAYHKDTGYWTDTPNMPDGTYGLDLRGGLWWVGVEPMYSGVDWYFDPDWEQPVEFPHDPGLELTEWITLTVGRAEFFHVTGVVTTPNGLPIVPGTVEVELCDDEGHCFGNPAEPNGDFVLWALPGIYRFWVRVDPDSHLLPPLDNGFDVSVFGDLDLGMFRLRAIGDRTASVSGRVIVGLSGQGLAGVEIEAWTDTGDWNRTETVENGQYSLDLFPGYWRGGPRLSEEQEELYVVWPPRQREGYLEAGDTISNVNFYLLRRDATIRGLVVDISTTLPITDINAIVFAEHCPRDGTLPCRIVAEDEVRDGAFELKVVGNYTYTLGIWLPSGGYMPGPPVEVFVGRNQIARADVAVIEAGTRIHGYLLDPDGERVYLPASVYGTEPVEGYWVEDHLWPEKEPYEYELWVPTPASEPMAWTLWLGVDPGTGYIADPAHPDYSVVVPAGETNILEIMYVRELDTQVTGTVVVFDGTNLVPAPYVWVFAEGIEGTDSEGLYFEAKTNGQGHFAMYVLPGEYLVNAYLPPHLAKHFFPPLPKEWDSVDDNPVILKFRPRPTRALSISGSLTVSPTGALDGDAPILVLGWSKKAGYSEVTGTLDSGYRLPVISNTTWYVWAVYEDSSNDALYFSEAKRVSVGTTDVSGVNLTLELADYPLPDAICESFDPFVFKRISLPTRPGVPEPLIEIQAGTMPVSGTVEVCATPMLGVPGGYLLVGFAYEIEARDSQGNLITEDFNKSARMIFYYNADMLGDVDPEALTPAFFSTARQEWVPLEDVFIDPDDWFVTGKIDHFSRFGIRGGTAAEAVIYLPLVLRNYES